MKDRLGPRHQLATPLKPPHEGDWGVTLKAEYFAKIKSAGFQNVRIPVRWSARAAPRPRLRSSRRSSQVDWAVREALKSRLVPVLNMHHYDEIFKDPDGHRRRFLAFGSRSQSTIGRFRQR